jgi:7-cyano-7-deazaguanine synthase
MNPIRRPCVVLLSGGMDSSVAAALARSQGRELHALSFRYGQRHSREITLARRQARALGCASHRVLSLPLAQVAAGSLLVGQKAPLGRRGGVPATYVSFHNGIFLALAFAWAETLGADEVWGGWCRTDHQGYPDCRLPFFRAFEKAARLGTAAGSRGGARLKVVAPLSGLSKAQTVALGLRLGVDLGQTYTCYAGGSRPCGKCDACRLRAQGFRAAGERDPLTQN